MVKGHRLNRGLHQVGVVIHRGRGVVVMVVVVVMHQSELLLDGRCAVLSRCHLFCGCLNW
jgi:hypothetical protein